MASYRRRGHWRSGSRTPHWVSEHNVNRYWTAEEWGMARSPGLAAWLLPNATCPVCGALVYFYANAHGSRVFFDTVGVPWDKHPCTDNRTDRVTADSPDPQPRAPTEVQRYRNAAKRAGIELPPKPTAFPLIVNAIERARDGVRLTAVAVGLLDDYAERFLILDPSPAFLPDYGDVIYRAGSRLRHGGNETGGL